MSMTTDLCRSIASHRTTLACALIVAAVGSGVALAAEQGPDFGFAALDGAQHTLSESRGQVVLLEFWAPWCIPCRKGFPFLDGLQSKYQAAGLKVVAVTLETDDDSVRSFAAEHAGKLLVGRDPSGRAGELYQLAAMPTAILLDREGRVLARFEGGTEAVHEQIETAVSAVLNGQPLEMVAAMQPRPGATAGLRAWERGYLADPIMNLDGDTLTRSMREHVHASKEAAAGDGGVAGGGCGCN